jgi:hypothetical protein
VFRADAAILYFNCEFMRERFLEFLALEAAAAEAGCLEPCPP